MQEIIPEKKVYASSLFVRIVITVVIGIMCLAAALGAFHFHLSKKVFIDNFSKSQDKIFNQIDEEFYSFYERMIGILQKVTTDPMVIQYMKGTYEDAAQEWLNIQGMTNAIDHTELEDYPEFSLLLAGGNGRSYIHSSPDRLAMTAEDIWDSPFSRRIRENPELFESTYLKGGYTETMQHAPVIVFARGIREHGSGQVDGIALLTIKEADFRKLYEAYISQTSNILIFNQKDELLSAGYEKDFQEENQEKNQEKAREILHEMEDQKVKKMKKEFGSTMMSYQIQRFRNTSYKMLGVIDAKGAFQREYHMLTVILLTLVITGVVVLVIFYLVRAQTRPLYRLAQTMRKVGQGDLEAYVQVQGTDEVKELSRTYNAMLTELNRYIHQMMDMQEEKRKLELHALQMQINPHYMYNTLASIKWLIWQGNTEKSTQVIDAFISLLRNTISNMDEFIPLEQEMENLRNYVLIHETRYGDQIKTEFYMSPMSGKRMVPKLILQPFVENAFFHAFPDGRSGTIQIFVKEKEGYLWIEITDNGVGLSNEKLESLKKKTGRKGEHFTGIGINNVDDRIQLIYGKEYGIQIQSKEERGTTIRIRMPL